MYSTTNWHASIAASLFICVMAPLPAAAADLGGYEAAGTSYYGSDRRPLDNSYRDGYGPVNWTGLYLGGHGGWGAGQDAVSNSISRDADTSGFFGGVHGGYNYQSGALVAGLELDGDWLGVDGSSSLSGGQHLDVATDWLSSLRMRLGYATGNFLLYGTAGVAVGGVDVGISGPGTTSLDSQTLTGYAAGLGVEMALTPSITARLEGLHYGLGNETFATSRGPVDADLDLTTVRAGLSIKLN